MTKLKVGDRVIADGFPSDHTFFNKKGVIVEVYRDHIHGDDYVNFEADLGNEGLTSRGWFESRFTKLNDEENEMKTMTYRFIGTNKVLITFDFGEYHEIEKNNTEFTKVVDFLKYLVDERQNTSDGTQITQDDYNQLLGKISPKKRIEKFLEGYDDLKITETNITWEGETLHGVLVDRILWMLDTDGDVKPLINFLVNLQANPSYRVREQLFGFLDYGKNAITPDGHFLAYKYVNSDFKSVYDRKTDHSIGATVTMDRSKVDDDPNRTCSAGLHCCSKEYLGSYNPGQRVVVVKVNPRDVVAVPTDYNNTKMRCCQYKVVAELNEDEVRNDVLSSSPVVDSYEDHYSFIKELYILDYYNRIVRVKFSNDRVYDYDFYGNDDYFAIDERLDNEDSLEDIFNDHIRGYSDYTEITK